MELRGPSPAIATVEELALVKRFILLGLLVTVFTRDLELLTQSGLKTKGPYLEVVERAIDVALRDQASMKKRFRSANIRIYEEHRTAKGISCAYVCRGYRGRIELLWPFVRAEAEQLMRFYLSPFSSTNNGKQS